MSNVLARKRGVSEMEFYHCAKDLRVTATRFLMNDKYVSKRWKPVFTFPMLDLLRDMTNCICAANDIYPYNEDRLLQRTRLQDQAIEDCSKLWDNLQWMIETLFSWIDADHPMPTQLEQMGELLDRTESLLKAWRRSAKLVNYKTPAKS